MCLLSREKGWKLVLTSYEDWLVTWGYTGSCQWYDGKVNAMVQWFSSLTEAYLPYCHPKNQRKKSESFVLGLTVVNDGSLAFLKENKTKKYDINMPPSVKCPKTTPLSLPQPRPQSPKGCHFKSLKFSHPKGCWNVKWILHFLFLKFLSLKWLKGAWCYCIFLC